MGKYKTKYKVDDVVKLINNQVVTIIAIDDDDVDDGERYEYMKGLYNLNYEVQFANDDMMWVSLPYIKCVVSNLLTEEERTYLSNIVKPFKKDTSVSDIYITKHRHLPYYKEYIDICLYDAKGDYITSINFPSFEEGKYYKGLDLYKNYNVKELGI